MANLSVSLKPALLVKLDSMAEFFGFSKSKIAETAIGKYLEELEEEKRDLETAQKISAEIDSGKMKTYPAEDVYKELGLT
ncbi:MAG: DUF6290 family protein [Bacteroides sp.]|nr:DUF6290 family protein [Prevotella sp.]MCM1408919.1 DUF6290 family protein [Treponema brennaborense]MCM1470766.1 DUF6290 family protein [Bacteroides sp.]